MTTPKQKELWRKEKEQMLRDKAVQPREVRRRTIELKLEGQTRKRIGNTTPPQAPTDISDDILRKRLGI
jgi:hypothetical protein